MAGKKYWKILRVVMVITSENIGFITSATTKFLESSEECSALEIARLIILRAVFWIFSVSEMVIFGFFQFLKWPNLRKIEIGFNYYLNKI